MLENSVDKIAYNIEQGVYLEDDNCGIKKGIGRENEIQLESNKNIKKRGGQCN